MKTTKTLTAFAALAGMLVLSGCTSDTNAGSGQDPNCTPAHEFSTITPNELTVAVVPVPHLIDIENGALTGIEGDLLTGFAAAECLTIAPQEIGGAGIIPAVQSNRVDVATGGWAPTAEREEIVSFSAPTFADEVVILSPEGFGSFDELLAAGSVVGSPQGNRWVENADALLKTNHKIYQSFNETYNDLVAGRLDAALSTTASSLEFMASDAAANIKRIPAASDPRVEATVADLDAAFPVRKNNPELKKALDEYIQSVIADGTLESILSKWGMPESATPSAQ